MKFETRDEIKGVIMCIQSKNNCSALNTEGFFFQQKQCSDAVDALRIVRAELKI